MGEARKSLIWNNPVYVWPGCNSNVVRRVEFTTSIALPPVSHCSVDPSYESVMPIDRALTTDTS